MKNYGKPFKFMKRRAAGSGDPDYTKFIRSISDNQNYMYANLGPSGQCNRQQWQASGSANDTVNYGSASYVRSLGGAQAPIARHISNVYMQMPMHDGTSNKKTFTLTPSFRSTGSLKADLYVVDTNGPSYNPQYAYERNVGFFTEASTDELPIDYNEYSVAPGYKYSIALVNGDAEPTWTSVDGRTDAVNISSRLTGHEYDGLGVTSPQYGFVPIKTGSVLTDNHPANSSYLYKRLISNNGNIVTEDSCTFNTSYVVPWTTHDSSYDTVGRTLASYKFKTEYYVTSVTLYVLARSVASKSDLDVVLNGSTEYTWNLGVSTAADGWEILSLPTSITVDPNTTNLLELIGAKATNENEGANALQIAGVWLYEDPLPCNNWSTLGLSSSSLGTILPPDNYVGNDNVNIKGFFPILKDGNAVNIDHAGMQVLFGDQLWLKKNKRRCLVADWCHRYHVWNGSWTTNSGPDIALGAYINGIRDDVIAVDNIPCTGSAAVGYGAGSLVYKLLLPPAEGTFNRVDVWLEVSQYVARIDYTTYDGVATYTEHTRHRTAEGIPPWRLYATSSNGTSGTEFSHSNLAVLPVSSEEMPDDMYAQGGPSLGYCLLGGDRTFKETTDFLDTYKYSFWRDALTRDILRHDNEVARTKLVGPFTLITSSSLPTAIDINATFDILSKYNTTDDPLDVNKLEFRNACLLVHGGIFKTYYDPS